MSVVVKGKRRAEPITLEMGAELPPEIKAEWDWAISRQKHVGLQWWRAVPSYTEAEGFVAGAH
jgi:hypothetical protein